MVLQAFRPLLVPGGCCPGGAPVLDQGCSFWLGSSLSSRFGSGSGDSGMGAPAKGAPLGV